MNYLITTGWWCNDKENLDRSKSFGDDTIRGKDFHQLWYSAIRATGSKANIYIIDSASPVKPEINEGESLISLVQNFGHSTVCNYKLCGVTRAHILGMNLALLNEYDYWVYIEQDALVYGKGFIENAIKSMKGNMAFGNGKGTAYPAQQSFMIIKKESLSVFINRLHSIKSSDKEISPEMKFCIASSQTLSIIPEILFKISERRGILGKSIRLITHSLIKALRGFEYIPYGYGRTRPINFNDDFFYFQHGSHDEIGEFLEASKCKAK